MRLPYILVFLLIPASGTYAQLQPLFSQKISDGLMFDPSLAGYSGGSAIFGFKKQWAQVNGSPEYLYFGMHTRLLKERLGIGTNLYLEESNILENYCLSVPIAYHLPVTKTSGISFGLAPDLTRSQLNYSRLAVQDYSDPVIKDLDNALYVDFDYGMNFHNQLFQIGFSANRMISMLHYENAGSRPINGYLTGYGNLFLKLRDGKDRLEPTVIYRQQMHANGQMDVSVYYFHALGIIAGGSYRTGNIVAMHAGFSLRNRIVIGYSYEMLVGSYSGIMGGSHEAVCRYNFNKQYYERSDIYKTMPRSSITTRKKKKH